MKKKVTFLFLMSFIVMNVVSATGIWGSYKGNSIVRLTVGGEPIKVPDVPAINFDGRTMIPIYLLRQFGVDYLWDGENQTVDITIRKQTQPEVVKEKSIAEKTVELKDIGIKMYDLMSDGQSIVATYYFNDGLVFNSGINKDQFNQVLYHSLGTDTTTTRMVYSNGTEVMIANQSLRDYNDGKITASELQSEFKFTNP